MDTGLILCDPTGRVLRMNRRAMEMHEYASAAEAWQSLVEFADTFELYTLEGSSIPSADCPLSRTIRGEMFDELKLRLYNRRTGTERIVGCCGMPIRDPQGNTALAVLTLRTLDERTNEALRKSESRLMSIFRAAPVGIGLVSDRILLEVNDRLCEMTGYRREELIGRNARILYPTREEWEYVGREKYRQIQERGTGEVETHWRRKDGATIDILLSSTPLDPQDLSRGVTFTALDITARKRAEDELRSIFDLSLDMVCIADIKTITFTRVNPAFERTLGYSEQELLSRPLTDFIHPDDVDNTMAVLREKLCTGEHVFNFENRVRCKDGSYRWLNWTSHPRVEQGLTYAIARDVTARKQAEEAMRFTQFAIDHTADGAFWMARDATFCYVNEAACRALGYSRDELMKMTVYDIDPAFTETMWSESWRKLKAQKNIVFETVHRAKDGRVYPVEIRANYLEFGGQEFDCAFARDITERKQAEESLRESEERFRTAFEGGAVAMALTAMDSTLMKVNPSFCRMLGFSESELVGRSFTEITHPDDVAANLVGTRQLASGEISAFHMEKRYIRKDGAVVWADMNTASVPDAQGRPLYCVTHVQDISERKQAEEALRQSEARLNRSQEIAHLGSWELDLARDELTWSDEVYRIFGLQPQEFDATYEAFLNHVHPDDRKAVDEAYRNSVQEGRDSYEIEHRIIRKDTGEGRIVHEKCEHFRDAAGRIVRSVGMVHDVTDRKRAEAALRESEERNRRLIENLKGSHFIYRHDTEGVFRYVSESVTGILGYAPDEFMTRYDRYLTDHPANQAACRHTELTMQGIPQPAYEVNTWHKDGSTRWLEVQEVPVFDAAGKVIAVEGVAQDISERKQAEEALRESEERHRFLVESVNDWIWEMDRNGVYTYASPQCREMLGYEPEEIVGKTPFDLMPPEEGRRMQEAYVSFAGQAKPFRRLENVNRRKDGRLVVLETNGVPVLDAQGKLAGYRGVDRDITERKEAEETLREKEYLLSESQRIGHIGTWSVDLVANTATWTRETYRLFGVSPATFVPSAEALVGLLHPGDRDAMREWMRAALAGECPDVLEFRVVLPDGSIRIVSGRGELILAEDNRPVRLVGTVQDVTEQKRAEASLRELSRKNEEALRVARMGHWEFDTATGMFTFNDQYYTLHGTTALEAGGCRMTVEEFTRRYVHPDDAHLVQEALARAMAIEDPDFQFQTEARILRTNGEARWVTVWFRIEKDARGRTSKLYGVNQDITERRYAEEALRRLNENLELQVAQRTEALTHTVGRLQQLTWELSQAEDRERRRIADLLHDDVQQILAGARFHLNLLSMETRSAQESREIICQVRQMLKDAIEKARNLSHELSPALYQVDLAEILNWLACHMQRKHGLVVRVEVHGQSAPSSEPLKALLYKVAQELLFNVVKHAGVKEATIRVRRMGRCICLSVIDRGLGFDPKELEETAGFGLLSIRERVHLLGGRMKIKSAPGAGSRFLVVIPDEGPSEAMGTECEQT